jgi:hypothetical protein
MLISKKQTCLSDKMPPPQKKKLKLKKRFLISLSPIFFVFLILTFLGGILPLMQVCIFDISIKFSIFFIPIMTYYNEKNFTSQNGHFSTFLTEKPKKGRKRHKKNKNAFSKTIYTSFANPKLREVYQVSKIGQNHWTPMYM